MISKELYNLAIEADKEAENSGACSTCFCFKFKIRIQGSNLKHFLDWKEKNNIDTTCSSVLFYLQDLGIIKILSGAAKRTGGVKCLCLKIKVLHPEGNKI